MPAVPPADPRRTGGSGADDLTALSPGSNRPGRNDPEPDRPPEPDRTPRPDGDATVPDPGGDRGGGGERDQELSGRFGRYEIVRRLGRGGMGAVYLARDARLDRPVALKVPVAAADPRTAARFLSEARAAAALRHPHVCPIYDVGEERGRPFLTMPHLPGPGLLDAGDGRPRAVRAAVELVRKLADAMAHAHVRGVVHRDLKPSNVLRDEHGEPLVADFGVALRLAPAAGFAAGSPAAGGESAGTGTPAYMSPEQVRGDPAAVGPRSDLYSLGVILYELLTGAPPFAGPGLRERILAGNPEPPSARRADVDAELENIWARMTAADPDDRFPSMAAARDALDDWLAAPPASDGTVSESPPTPAGPAARSGWRARWPLPAALVVAAALLAWAAAAAVLFDRDPAPAGGPTAAAETPVDPADDWEELFDGESLAGWTDDPRDRGTWAVEPVFLIEDGAGGGAGETVPALVGRTPADGAAAWAWLVADRSFGNVEVRAVVRTAGATNSGVGVRHVPPGGRGGGFEGPQADVGVGPDGQPCTGGIFMMVPGEAAVEIRATADALEAARAARQANGEPPGWDVVTVRAVGARLEVFVNGVRSVSAGHPAVPPAGRLRLETFTHPWSARPGRAEFRSVRVRPARGE